MSTLYNITQEQMRLNDAIEEAEGVLTPELEEALSINADNLRTKAEGYAATIMDAKARLRAIKEERDRLDKIAKSEQRKVDILSSRLSDALQLFGIGKLEVDKYRLSFRKSMQVTIDDADSVPEEYRTVQVAFDKALIKTALSAGQEVPGASITEKMNLQIR